MEKSLITWTLKNDCLYKKFTFNNYIDTITFVNKIANYSEKINHHPKLIIEYNTVEVYLKNHELNKITKQDILSARKYDQYYSK